MVIKDVLLQLETSTHPVAKTLHLSTHFKVLVVGFKADMKLKDHQAHQPTKITVLSGQVIYSEGEKEVTLSMYDDMQIPVNTVHAITAVEDSLCLLTQG